MAFESLTDRLAGVFKKLRGHGKLTEADIKAAMREVRMALLEADVNYKVAKDFCAKVSERAIDGQDIRHVTAGLTDQITGHPTKSSLRCVGGIFLLGSCTLKIS